MVRKLKKSDAVYLVAGKRTPFIKAKVGANDWSASDLAVAAGKGVLNSLDFNPNVIDELILGCAGPSQDEANIARVVALRLGLSEKTSAFTVQRNCASGLQAIESAFLSIKAHKNKVVLCGGTEAMSRAPLIWQQPLTDIFARVNSAKDFASKLKALVAFRPKYLAPIVAILRGLTDSTCGLNMGQTAERLAFMFNITREMSDHFSVQSHVRSKAAEMLLQQECVPLFDRKGRAIEKDDGVREDANIEKLAKLKPVFEKPYGQVTAANSSQISDGAAFCLLASGEAVTHYHLPVIAEIKDITFTGVDPRIMGIGPTHAIYQLLHKHQLNLADIDRFEINEAFAAQVLACAAAFEDETYLREHFNGVSMGHLPMELLNQEGGAISLGHPVGASGARLTLHAAQMMHLRDEHRAVASLCIGGGQGGAILLERA